MKHLRPALRSLCALGLVLSSACVSGKKIRADTEVLQVDVERARRSGALECAPRELATAEANLDFARGELSQGSSIRAREHVRAAESAVKRALALSRQCGPQRRPSPQGPGGQQIIVKLTEADSDGDGVGDEEDLCPEQPEDRDGFEDADGCPETDNDRDGTPDGNDRCPVSPGLPANHGCPDEALDTDADGVPDVADACAGQPEDLDGFEDADGCPDLDNDADGVLDRADRCPLAAGPVAQEGCAVTDGDSDGVPDASDRCAAEPEDADGFEDADGCPDLDNDADGVPDSEDKCPVQAGPAESAGCVEADRDQDGVADAADRCPDEPGIPEEEGCAKKYKLVVIKKDRIEIQQQLKFDSGSSRITAAGSFAILDEVAQALTDSTFIKRIRIEGHTDSAGEDASNLRLSQTRADAVKAELIKRGIDPARMEAVGYGETRPLAPNTTARGRAENRRTEFNIVEE